ncbi:MAG TPA: DNA/RNA non-specific endonuclease [Longimicrobium sp.]|nr:DNA/RNA non-specific endonuclease [Longimicrobium sp.]
MKNSARIARDGIRRAQTLPEGVLEKRRLDFIPEQPRDVTAEVLANRAAFLPRGGAHPSKAEFERLLGTNDLLDEFYLERALLAAHPVCRISIRADSGHERGCATGFMVSPRLLLTNHHVFGLADEAAPSLAEFNFRFDVAGRPEASFRFHLRPDLFFHNNEALDYALVAVDPVSEDGVTKLSRFGYHRLIPQSGKLLVDEAMTVIQHPGGARRQFAIRENRCISDKDPDVLWYQSDTAQGSSGSPVLNDSFQVVALHHAGVPKQDDQERFVLKSGKTVPALDDVDDSEVDWVANAGIRVSRICADVLAAVDMENAFVAELKAAMDGRGDVLSAAFAAPHPAAPEAQLAPAANDGGTGNSGASGGRLVLGSLVLELGGVFAPQVAAAPAAIAPQLPPVAAPFDGSAAAVEALKEPIVDTDYTTRTGFDPSFLGVATPFPAVTDVAVVAPMLDGRTQIPYQHFTVVLHRERRMAIYTASNVDGRPVAKRPEAGRDYSRRGLTGLGPNDQEKWVIDSRVDAKFQIPDRFYTRDNGAFDKGHVVRREDVCFGDSYAQVRRANGDTFHVTNCTPQLGNFNRSNLGGIWGNLENFIGAQADEERYCIFAGPVLSPDDGTFAGTERVKIPTRFWKVVCATQGGALQVFAFLLEQNLKDVKLVEFQVTSEWKARQVSLAELEEAVKLVRFPKLYHQADTKARRAPGGRRRKRVAAPEIMAAAGSPVSTPESAAV